MASLFEFSTVDPTLLLLECAEEIERSVFSPPPFPPPPPRAHVPGAHFEWLDGDGASSGGGGGGGGGKLSDKENLEENLGKCGGHCLQHTQKYQYNTKVVALRVQAQLVLCSTRM